MKTGKEYEYKKDKPIPKCTHGIGMDENCEECNKFIRKPLNPKKIRA